MNVKFSLNRSLKLETWILCNTLNLGYFSLEELLVYHSFGATDNGHFDV